MLGVERSLRLVAAPLAELVEKRELEEKEFEGGVRFGADYEFEFGHFSLAPFFFVDLVGRETLLVYGVAGGIFF